MEESEKRKERLRAMRMEAAQSEVSYGSEASAATSGLSNPLIQPFSAPQAGEGFQATPRFDFYTDPMAAFSANRRRSSGLDSPSGFPGPRNIEMTPPLHQMRSTVYRSQGPYGGGRPVVPDPAHMHQGSPGAWNEPGNPIFNVRPRGMVSPASMHQGPPPGAWNRSYQSRGGGSPSPGFASVRSPNFHYGQGRSQWYGSNPVQGSESGDSPCPVPGRGRGQGYGGNFGPNTGRGGGRGSSFHGRGSTYRKQLGPECYFHESMLEDPWKNLEPVLWRRREAPMSSSVSASSSSSWLPTSIGMKKARVSEAPRQSSSGPSLAEYLAASFNEAVDDKPSGGNAESLEDNQRSG